MASDTTGPPAKPVIIGSGRLGRPVKVSSSKRDTPSPRSPTEFKGIPSVITSDRGSDTSLSDQGDSEAETERLHISPLKQRPKMVAYNASTMAVELPHNKVSTSDHNDKILDNLLGSPNLHGLKKKRKRDEKENPTYRSPDEGDKEKLVSVSPPKKKYHVPFDSKETKFSSSNQTSSSKRPKSAKLEEFTNHDRDKRYPNIPLVDNSREGQESPEPQLASPLHGSTDEPMMGHTAVRLSVEECVDNGEVAREEDEDIERALKKKQAMEDLAEIERIFAKLKDSIYNEKLRRVEIEMKLLVDGTHPEYVAQKACVDHRLQEKIRLADAQYEYAMDSLDTATHVSRAQIHSQYFQQTRQLREDTLYACSELWYHIQRERRVGDSLVPDYTYRIPDRQSTRIKQRMQYNWEVQILGAVQKHIGFPAAPDVGGATEEEKIEDFEELGISPRAPLGNSTSLGIMRIEERAASHQFQITNPSPPSPVTQSAQQIRTHSHVHRHHHHYHRPHIHAIHQVLHRQPEQSVFNPQHQRRNATMSNLGPNPAVLPLSSLLQSSEATVKTESQLLAQPMRTTKATDSLPSYANQVTQRHIPYHSPNNSLPRVSGIEHQFSQSLLTSNQGVIGVEQIPGPADMKTGGKDHDLDGTRRLQEDIGSSISSSITADSVGQLRFPQTASRAYV